MSVESGDQPRLVDVSLDQTTTPPHLAHLCAFELMHLVRKSTPN
jgi:hypothetical protein